MDSASGSFVNGGGNVKKWHGLNSIGGMAKAGWWPTPTVCGNYNRKGASVHSGDGLGTVVRQFQTVRASDGDRGGRGDLIQAVRGHPNAHYRLWPMPTKSDGHGGAGNGGLEGGNNLRTEVVHQAGSGGALNPDWVAWLMGWPLGWEDVAPLPSGAVLAWAARVRSQWLVDPAEGGQTPRTMVHCKARKQRISALGNGQVPLCAAMAWQWLMQRHAVHAAVED